DMTTIDHLFENNKEWAARIESENPGFFAKLSEQQAPEYLWIGCSDSRVPANQIVGLLPGEVFVHRNIANQVIHTDFNCLSVLQFAVDVIKVKHIIVCGHYGCGGVQAAMKKLRLGLVDNWLMHIQDTANKHKVELEKITDENSKWERLCEINVKEQVASVADTTVLQDAWNRGQKVAVHGLIYGLKDGILKNLNVSRSS
ncbi:MAG: carbonate dehydratase, partial [Rickettsiales bacterium]